MRKAAEEPEAIRPCVGANDGCFGRLFRTRPISCLVNPAVGLERELGVGTAPCRAGPARAGRRRRPAGLEAARVAAERGHAVTSTRPRRSGGALRLASLPAARRELWELVDFQVAAVQRAGVEVVLGAGWTPGTCARQAPRRWSSRLAPGRGRSRSRWPNGARVLAVAEAIALATSGGASERVVIIDDVGHFPAYVPAELLAEAGAQVTVVTPRLHAGAGLDDATLTRTLRRLGGLGVMVLSATVALAVEHDGVLVRHAFDGSRQRLPATVVVAAIGGVADDALVRALADLPCEVRAVGDCVAPRTALEAVRDGHLVGAGPVTRWMHAAGDLPNGCLAASRLLASATVPGEQEPDTVQRLLDRAEIQDCLARYCRGVDRCDVGLVRSAYHPDATDDHGTFKGNGWDFAEHIVAAKLAGVAFSMHVIANVLIEHRDADRATSRCTSSPTSAPWMTRACRSSPDGTCDDFTRRDGAWRIAARTVASTTGAGGRARPGRDGSVRLRSGCAWAGGSVFARTDVGTPSQLSRNRTGGR